MTCFWRKFGSKIAQGSSEQQGEAAFRGEKSAGQRFRRLFTLEGERLSAVVAFGLFAFMFDLLLDGAFALGLFAFVLDLLFAGTPALIVVAASQTSPMPLPSLSVCVGLGIPTQLS